MARIPDAELERLKQDIALQRLAEIRGIQLKRHGTDLIGLCSFHDEHDSSLVISPDKNLWQWTRTQDTPLKSLRKSAFQKPRNNDLNCRVPKIS